MPVPAYIHLNSLNICNHLNSLTRSSWVHEPSGWPVTKASEGDVQVCCAVGLGWVTGDLSILCSCPSEVAADVQL